MLLLNVESILTLLNDQRLGASLQEAMSDEEAEEVRFFILACLFLAIVDIFF